MREETLIAVVLGVGLGLITTIVFIYSTHKPTEVKTVNKPTPTPQAKQENKILIVSEPLDETISKEATIKITGKVSKGSLLVVQSPFDTEIRKNTEEDFSINFPLQKGENLIRLSMYPPNSQTNVQEKLLKIFYLPDD